MAALAAETLQPSEKKIISVGDLTRRIKKSIEDAVRYVWVAGEMSNYKGPGPSGHPRRSASSVWDRSSA